MDPGLLTAIAFAVVGFGVLSRRAERGILTPPMVFVVLGFLASEHGLGLVDIELEHAALHGLAELTLVLVLFTDAARIDLACLRREESLPLRLLGIGLPLTLAAGALAAYLLLGELEVIGCLLLGALLAPTDAALGQAVVTSPDVPVRIRQTLNAESGLNDGLAVPAVLMLATLAAGSDSESGAFAWLGFAVQQVGLGVLAGALIGVVGARVFEWSLARDGVTESFQRLAGLGLAVLAFASAELVGGNGFIAAFVGGVAFGNTARGACAALYAFGEAEGQLLTLLVFFAFGAVLLPTALSHFDAAVAAYAIASLTVVRMVPVALALLGSGLRPASWLFLGWFGPRGLASVLFVLVILEKDAVPQAETIAAVVLLTVLFSVFLHGATAHPFAALYARHIGKDEDAGEHLAVPEMPPGSVEP